MPQKRKRNVAVLVGNGLSIAFNEKLLLSNITKQVRRRILNSGDDGRNVARAMRELANVWLPPGETSNLDFERLVGAFGAEGRSLSHLQSLAQYSYPDDRKLRKSIEMVIDFAQELRDVGTGHVLEVVYRNSRSNHTESEPLEKLVQAVYVAFPGRVTFGNLNYDTLLLAALINVKTRGFADLAWGGRGKRIKLGDGEVRAQPLRATAEDFPPASNFPVQLLHLHGSLTYWGTTDGKQFGKLERTEVMAEQLFEKLRQGTTDLRPLVVLNRERQKIDDVLAHPFKLAYEMFKRGLEGSNHWLIIGYSFRDVAVNDLLRREFISRAIKPKVLVVAHGATPSEEEIEVALGWGAEDESSQEWLRRNEDGAFGMQDHETWEWFSK